LFVIRVVPNELVLFVGGVTKPLITIVYIFPATKVAGTEATLAVVVALRILNVKAVPAAVASTGVNAVLDLKATLENRLVVAAPFTMFTAGASGLKCTKRICAFPAAGAVKLSSTRTGSILDNLLAAYKV
jgi:hypothetical protein